MIQIKAQSRPLEVPLATLRVAVEKARLRVPIAAAFSLAQEAKAHERLERGHVLGRIALKIHRPP
jgi:hypothetical protein